MANRLFILIPFFLAVPLAIVLGFSASSADSIESIGIMALCFVFLALPLLLRWHFALLLLAWNSAITIPFLPGSLKMWMIMSGVSLVVSFVSTALSGEDRYQKSILYRKAGLVTASLVFFAVVVLFTAWMRGGIGLRTAGSQMYGGGKYLFVMFSILGYFALRKAEIPARSRWLFLKIFFGGFLLLAVGNFVYMAGPSFYWLFLIFPVDYTSSQIAVDSGRQALVRLGGVSFATVGPVCYMLIRHGVSGILDARHWHRLALMLALVVATLIGGFRSLLAFYIIMVLIISFYERFWTLKNVAIVAGMIVVGGVLLIPFTNKLPLTIQRSISFLPLNLDPIAVADAQISTEWRFRMWEELWNETPKYFWLGKGYAFNPMDRDIAQAGGGQTYEAFMISGDYHSGPFSIQLSFGIAGTLAMILFWYGSIRFLRQMYFESIPELKKINLLLYAFFVAKLIIFVFIAGDIATELAAFVGVVGLSIALNKPAVVPDEAIESAKT